MIIAAEIYGITPSAKIDILDRAPPENILNISRILPLCCSNKNFITEGSIPGNVMKLPNLNTTNANIIKNIRCLSSPDFVKPPIPEPMLELVLTYYLPINSITDFVQ